MTKYVSGWDAMIREWVESGQPVERAACTSRSHRRHLARTDCALNYSLELVLPRPPWATWSRTSKPPPTRRALPLSSATRPRRAATRPACVRIHLGSNTCVIRAIDARSHAWSDSTSCAVPTMGLTTNRGPAPSLALRWLKDVAVAARLVLPMETARSGALTGQRVVCTSVCWRDALGGRERGMARGAGELLLACANELYIIV